MRRTWTLLIGLATIAGLSLAGTAIASHGENYDTNNPWTASGEILIGSPGASPTEPCNEGSGADTGNGVFGDVYALPDGGDTGTGDGDHWFEFEVTDLAGADLEWYQAGNDCESLGTKPSGQTTLCCHTLGTRAETLTVDFQGEVPVGATHVVIDFGGGYGSGPGAYELTIPVESPGTCDKSPFC